MVFSAYKGKLDSGGFRATRLHDGMKTFLFGADLPLKVVSIYNVRVETVQPIPLVRAEAQTWWEASSSSTSSLSPWLLELCAGFGGMCIGASFLGGLPGISVDWTPHQQSTFVATDTDKSFSSTSRTLIRPRPVTAPARDGP